MYVDIYTGSRCLDSEAPPKSAAQSHAHPDPISRWQGRGFGSRHINDDIPFSLWSEDGQKFRDATVEEMRYIQRKFDAEKLSFVNHLIIIETSKPPQPVPLTVGCTPAIFVTPGQEQKYTYGLAPYVNPRAVDPCPHLSWRGMQRSEEQQMMDVISVLMELGDIQRVNFFPASIVVELVHGNGRVYSTASLPAVVAGLPTTYHHDPLPFFVSMKDRTRERLLDPRQYLPGPSIGPLPQDGTNYLREPSWGVLCPGVRVSTGSTTDSGYANAVQSSTCGVLLRKGTARHVSVANHGFFAGSEVFHPVYNGDKIGDIVDRYPELDLAMVQLTPANSGRFSNETYFQAEPPKRLAKRSDLDLGSWFEVDGMSTGLISFQLAAKTFQKPKRPPGHPEIPALQWRRDIVFRIFGASSPELMDGLCGAPFVEVNTVNVAGFFHLANGDWAECAALDDLVAEGWEVA